MYMLQVGIWFFSSSTHNNYVFNFDKDNYFIYFRNELVACGFIIDSFYHLHMDVFVNVYEWLMNVMGSNISRDETNLKYIWHFKLGHVGKKKN